MAKAQSFYGFDGTTGKSNYGGRRTHVIQLLRDSREPLSVAQVAEATGVHINTARFHLESLVDSGLADRRQEPRSTPGRPKVLYVGTLPNQTHERAQGYRLLAESLAMRIGDISVTPEVTLYQAGVHWGARLAELTENSPLNDSAALSTVVEKLDALWFAPELVSELNNHKIANGLGEVVSELNGSDFGLVEGQRAIILHHAPFITASGQSPRNICSLNAGLINGLFEALGSTLRINSIFKVSSDHHSVAPLSSVDVSGWTPDIKISITK